jgi:hypothetical protein
MGNQCCVVETNKQHRKDGKRPTSKAIDHEIAKTPPVVEPKEIYPLN